MQTVLICYSKQDIEIALAIYNDLKAHGINAWIDVNDLLPGESKHLVIKRKIKESSHVIILFSKNSVVTRGIFQKEINEALEVLSEIPPDQIYVIPISVDGTKPLHDKLKNIHMVDLSASYDYSLTKIFKSIKDYKFYSNIESSTIEIAAFNRPTVSLSPISEDELLFINILKNKISKIWINSVLKNSIINNTYIDREIELKPDVIENPWDGILDIPKEEERLDLREENIFNEFIEFGSSLLILGEEGSGKTVILLKLANQLLINNSCIVKGVPVIFHLSTWNKKQNLLNWLTEELKSKYQIPKKIGIHLIKNYRIYFLLDGLDEVNESDRTDCIAAINYFIEDIGALGISCCCRLNEYKLLSAKLRFNKAIYIPNLKYSQILEYINKLGCDTKQAKDLFENNNDLLNKIKSPLMLNIIIMTFYNCFKISFENNIKYNQHLKDFTSNTHIWKCFIKSKLINCQFSEKKAMKWLGWLSKNMNIHSKSIFQIEELQPSWLMSRFQIFTYYVVNRLIIGFLFGVLFLFLLPIYQILFSNHFLLEKGTFTTTNIIITFLFPLLFCFLSGIIDFLLLKKKYSNAIPFLIHFIANGLIVLLTIKLFAFTIIPAYFFSVLFGLRSRDRNFNNDIHTFELVNLSLKSIFKKFLFSRMPANGFDAHLISVIIENINIKEIEKTTPNQGIKLSIRNSIHIGATIGISIAILSYTFSGLGSLGDSYLTLTRIYEIAYSVYFGGIVSIILAICYGGLDSIQHYVLRLILCYNNFIPLNYIKFLDYMTTLCILQKVGGGYKFLHKNLLDIFSNWKE
ncbi:MAG: TIR domain-containing protein [Desulfococcaceae bacterium]